MWAKLGAMIVDRILALALKYLPQIIANYLFKLKRKNAQAEADKKLDETLKKPDLSAQEKADAINSHRNAGK